MLILERFLLKDKSLADLWLAKHYNTMEGEDRNPRLYTQIMGTSKILYHECLGTLYRSNTFAITPNSFGGQMEDLLGGFFSNQHTLYFESQGVAFICRVHLIQSIVLGRIPFFGAIFKCI